MTTPYHTAANVELWHGDALTVLRGLEADSVQAACSSPPYYQLRRYGCDGELGSEAVMDCLGWATGARCGECFVCHLVEVFAEVRRVLRPGGRLTVVDWQARSTERGPPMHERVPKERVPSLFPGLVLERGYEDDNYYHLELRKA